MPGLVAALLVTAIAGPRLAIFTGIRFTLMAPVHLVRYLGYFLVALVKANLDVAWRVLAPSLPIRPGVVQRAHRAPVTPGAADPGQQHHPDAGHPVGGYPGRYHPDSLDRLPPRGGHRAGDRAIVGSFERHISGFLK